MIFSHQNTKKISEEYHPESTNTLVSISLQTSEQVAGFRLLKGFWRKMVELSIMTVIVQTDTYSIF